MTDSFDIAVVGAGPGGYVAAIRAAQLGLTTVIIERQHLGGICLNWGCIPTKALLKSGEVYASLSNLHDYGVAAADPALDIARLVRRSRDAAAKLSAGVAFLMKKNGIEVVEGTATLARGEPAPTVVVELNSGGSRIIAARSVILATGAHPRVIPTIGMVPDGERIWTYREAMVPSELPRSIVVIGSGAIGIEFASFYRALGVDVTVIETFDRILPTEDAEIATAAQKAFEKRGVKFRLAANVLRLVRSDTGVIAVLESGDANESLEAEVAILAIGIEGNTEQMGLEMLGLGIERGRVVTADHGETNVPGLYAIGDVAGPPRLAHKASHEGIRCVEHIAGVLAAEIRSPIPSCTYAQPQIASVGLTEEQARSRCAAVKVGRYPFRHNGKAIAAGETDGFVKTIFDGATGELLGAHMLGAEVTELIQGYVIAMTLEATEAELIAAVFPHPTLSEAMHEAALDAYGIGLHI